ncbi:MAG: nucleoside hydrolase, partial [Microthrixaceae bacterium]
VELVGRDVPVYRGEDQPLKRSLETAPRVHGEDGMGDIGLPVSGRSPAPGDAVDVIIETVHRLPGEVTLVALGPLTNIARALRRDPSISALVGEFVMMGGVGSGPGNVTPVAEFNIWVDPDAAKEVFESDLPVKMVGWDPCYTSATLSVEDCAKLRAVGSPLARFCVDIQKTLQGFYKDRMGHDGTPQPDQLAMAIAIDPTIALASTQLYVAVEADSELTRGQTVVDHLGVTGNEANTEVVLTASGERLLELLHDAVKQP